MVERPTNLSVDLFGREEENTISYGLLRSAVEVCLKKTVAVKIHDRPAAGQRAHGRAVTMSRVASRGSVAVSVSKLSCCCLQGIVKLACCQLLERRGSKFKNLSCCSLLQSLGTWATSCSVDMYNRLLLNTQHLLRLGPRNPCHETR